jgi:hypothetical protein
MNPFASVIAKLTKGSPPDWLPRVLAHYSRLVGAREPTKDDDAADKLLIDAARVLERGLGEYSAAEDATGLELPPCVDTVLGGLPEVIEFLETQVRPPRKGGPAPDNRRLVCAAVCAEVWRLQHGAIQPYSPNLQEACELYWQACGNDETSKSASGRLKNWEPNLLDAAKDEGGFRDDFLRLVTDLTTS